MIDQLIAQGKELMQEERYDEAIARFELAVKQGNDHPEARYHLALAHNKLSNYPKSLEIFETLVEEYPSNPDYRSERGVIYFNMGRPEKSLADLDTAVNLEPDHGYRFSSRAFVKEKTGDLEGAVRDYKMAIEIDPADKISRNNLELAEEKLGYQKKNKQQFQRTKYHFTDQEIADYKSKYEERNGKVEEDKEVHDVSLGNLLREMGSVFTSRSKMREFLAFVKNGFRHNS